MHKIFSVLISGFLLATSGMSMAKTKQIYGYIEPVKVDNEISLFAKLDTGAKSASLYAINVQIKTQDGKKRAYFTVPMENGQPHKMSAPFVGYVRIKVRHGEKKAIGYKKQFVRRPVVTLFVKMGDKKRKLRVDLANRENFNYPMLLGRDAIKRFDGIIDPALKGTVKK